MSDTTLFLVTIIPATVLLGIVDVLVRKVLKPQQVNEQLLLSFEYFGTAAITIVFLFFSGIPEIQPGFWSAAVATILLNAFAGWAWYAAFKREEASLISPLRLLTPPLVIVTGFFILGEQPSFGGIAGILLTVVGLWFFFDAEARFSRIRFLEVVKRRGVLLGIYGAVSFAFSLPFDKKVVITSSSVFAVVVVFAGIGLINFAIALARRRANPLRLFTPENRRTMITLPFVHAAASFLSYAALNYALVAYVGSIKRLWSLWAVIFAGAFLKEGNIKEKMVATFVMLAGIAVTVIFG